MEVVRVAEVALDPRTVGSEAVYTYAAEPDAHPGQVVLVPLGTRSLVGVVLRVFEASEETLGFPIKSLRPIEAPIQGVELPAALLDLAEMIAQETLCDLPTALVPAVPAGVKERVSASWALTGADLGKLSSVQAEIVKVLGELGELVERKGGAIDPGMLKHLRALRKRGVVKRTLRVPSDSRRSGAAFLSLNPDAEKIERFLKAEARKKPAQALVLMQLQGEAATAFERGEIRAMAGVTDATLKALVAAGLLREAHAEDTAAETPPEPNFAQRLAIDAIAEPVRERRAQTFLLYGVTGSGKTEVYLRAVSEALQTGRQALYLVPEIALATQAIARLRARFGSRVAVLHSELTPRERLANWIRIRNGECPVVLGARSALFAPLDNLGLVVVDEEHETSYKQESSPRYHARQLARYLGQRHECPVVLGSATPSVESYEAAERDEFTLISLPTRAQDQAMPTVHLVDLASSFRDGQPALLANPIPAKLAAVVARGEQAILFLNRRAYAPFLLCRDCGERMACPRCAVSLSFHRSTGWLQCHQCGYHARPPDTCPKCFGTRMKPMGIGTEKVEEAVRELLPGVEVARLDRDVAQRKGALEETLAAFRSGEIQVLVGTQMVAKGLDFPNVTLVVVISADISLNIPDFRASERTFQLLSQVAGRAGRGGLPGEVYIQTFSPDHIAVTCAQDHDFVRFFDAVREEREATGYPPFRRMVNLVASGVNRQALKDYTTDLADQLLKLPIEVLGPADCPLERVQNRWRRHILLKLSPGQSPSLLLPALKPPEGHDLQLLVDVDPYSLM